MSNIFISGEKIDICAPEDKDFVEWAAWFNNKSITTFLEQGKYPNTLQQQISFYNTAINDGRFIGLIKDKNSLLLGVISLSSINYDKRSCQISLVCPKKSKHAPLAALEAMALMTNHAFDVLGMDRIWAGQAYPGLQKWNNTLAIIGYKTEGFGLNAFRKGCVISNTVNIAILKSDYLYLSERRENGVWPGENFAFNLLKLLRKNSISERILAFIEQEHREYDKFLLDTENKLKEM